MKKALILFLTSITLICMSTILLVSYLYLSSPYLRDNVNNGTMWGDATLPFLALIIFPGILIFIPVYIMAQKTKMHFTFLSGFFSIILSIILAYDISLRYLSVFGEGSMPVSFNIYIVSAVIIIGSCLLPLIKKPLFSKFI